MGEQGKANGTSNKVEWVKAIGTWFAAMSIVGGIITFHFKKEKEASDRLLHIIALLDSKNCKTVRTGAVTTMGVYLEGYRKFQNRAYWVMASNLATENDPLVRDNILNILKGATTNAIEPLACMNRFLLEEETRRLSSFLFNIDLVFQKDLDNGRISDELRQKFVDSYVELSECVVVLVMEKDSRWFITNKDNQPTYIVRKERDQLNVYEKDVPRGPVYGSSSPVSTPIEPAPIDKFSFLQENENLFDITKALAVLLEKKGFPKDEKLQLQKIILCNIEPSFKINLDGAYLNQASLIGACLKGVSLKEAILEQANLQDAVLNDVDLTDADMRGANLYSVKLQDDTILRGADLSGAFLFSIDTEKFQSGFDKDTISEDLRQEFENNGICLSQNAMVTIEKNGTKYIIFDDGKRKCRIYKAQKKLNVYSDAVLKKARLEYTNLRDAYLTNADLSNAVLIGADLTDANLVEADLTDVSLSGATLCRTNMEEATLQRADLLGAVLAKANLAGANLFKADLTDANLSEANLKGANLSEANLSDSNLSDSDLIGTNLEGANLEGVNLDGADLESADLRALLLFDVDSKKFQSDLDKGTISEDLRKKFKDYLIDLSENTGISVKEKGRMWLIDDKNSGQTYAIRKEEQLNIYKRTKFDFNSIKKANNWDKATFDVDIWEKFSSQRD